MKRAEGCAAPQLCGGHQESSVAQQRDSEARLFEPHSIPEGKRPVQHAVARYKRDCGWRRTSKREELEGGKEIGYRVTFEQLGTQFGGEVYTQPSFGNQSRPAQAGTLTTPQPTALSTAHWLSTVTGQPGISCHGSPCVAPILNCSFPGPIGKPPTAPR